MYGTTAQIASAAGVAAIGAAFFAMEAAFSARLALFASLALLRCRLWPVPRFCRGCGARLGEVN
jgi:hypothetical protein